VKLPSGNWTKPNVGRSVQVGTGSTGILFGVYYSGLSLGKLKIRPIGQAIFTTVGSDSGTAASGQNNGFQ
jgi:hypothetical protein